MCNEICKDCTDEISRVTQIVKVKLMPFSDTLTRVWSLQQRSSDILTKCTAVNQLLDQVSQERGIVLRSHSTVSCECT